MALFPGLFHTRFACRTTMAALLSSFVVLSAPAPVQAGCGCDKPPPELAAVRPNVTYAGRDVTLTHATIQSGQHYEVTFTSGMTGASATVAAVAVTQRDLADSQEKPQLVVTVPALPLGPTSLSVSLAGQSGVVMTATDDVFTLAPQPLVFTEDVGTVSVPDYQAAVSRSGVVYISLDVTAMQLPRTFTAQALGYPLRFTNNDVVFHNTQGFLMQLLDEGMPGLFAIHAATGSPDSDTLQYARHEFHTYFLQHAERQAHAVDPTDPNWHLDGTPHIDHDQLIVAIAGMLDDGSTPVPGATPPTELVLSAQSFFEHGLVGDVSVALDVGSAIDSYHSQDGNAQGDNAPSQRRSAGAQGDSDTSQDGSMSGQGDVHSNGTLRLFNSTPRPNARGAVIDGDATAFAFDITSGTITGAMTTATTPIAFLPVALPTGLEDLGSLVIGEEHSVTVGPGSYHVSQIRLSESARLIIDNTAGPVTLYVSGTGTPTAVSLSEASRVSVLDPTPEKFALYVSTGRVSIGSEGAFHGVVYAPHSLVELQAEGQLYGAVVGASVSLHAGARVHYDTALRGEE